MNGGGDELHTNTYVALKQTVNIFVHTLARKEQVITKGVK